MSFIIFMYYIMIVFIPISQLFPDSLPPPTNRTSCSFSLFQEKRKQNENQKQITQILQIPKAKEIPKQNRSKAYKKLWS